MSNNYTSILVSTDLSDNGNAALEHASRVAREGGKIIILHALDIHQTPSPLYAHYVPGNLLSPEDRAQLKASLNEKLREMSSGLFPQNEIEVVVSAKSWPPHEAIIETAQERGAEIIVMASHGLTSAMHMLVGSTTEQVIRHSRIPVLVIPQP